MTNKTLINVCSKQAQIALKGIGIVKFGENKFTKSAEYMKFHIAGSFICNFGATSENFGLRKVNSKGRHLHNLLGKL